ncbi:hypothetical protein FOZ61_003619 [Perkinsus olseni]|uniref:Serine aminopeptidase S33 domain-containing protein n=1 Tax=Perkinsus olseni TaxID=32597 RepID=A0A7J6LNX4_PEROL|nr:hypothetical protein FOZ61_003619 [Perkinsus olseni]
MPRAETDFGEASAFALWNLIIRPPRREYDESCLGPKKFKLHGITCQREDFTVTSLRGHGLRCSLFVPRGLRDDNISYPCVVYMHGNAGCRLEALPLVPILLPLGISLCCFDFAGCGLSDGEYVTLGHFESEDLHAVVEHLRRLPSVGVVALWGRSMGAVTALLYASRHHDIAGMVVDSPFANLAELVQELAVSEYVGLRIPSWLVNGILSIVCMMVKQKADFDVHQVSPIDCVGQAYLPCIFLCATSDTFVPPHHSERLYGAYGGDDKVMIQLVGEHNTPRRLEDMKHAVTYLCTCFLTGVSFRDCAETLGWTEELGRSSSTWMVSEQPLDVPFTNACEACKALCEFGEGLVSRCRLLQRDDSSLPAAIYASYQLPYEREGGAGLCVALANGPSGGHRTLFCLILSRRSEAAGEEFRRCLYLLENDTRGSDGMRVVAKAELDRGKGLEEASTEVEARSCQNSPVLLCLTWTSRRPGRGCLLTVLVDGAVLLSCDREDDEIGEKASCWSLVVDECIDELRRCCVCLDMTFSPLPAAVETERVRLGPAGISQAVKNIPFKWLRYIFMRDCGRNAGGAKQEIDGRDAIDERKWLKLSLIEL